jgi:hypothetical protein
MEGKMENQNEQPKQTDQQQHRAWVKEEFDETKREKKKMFGFQKKFTKWYNSKTRAMFGGKFTHGTQGKPTHGPRGNQG